MKKLTSLISLILIAGLFLATASSACATVTLTGASGGSSISADTASNAVSPAWTTPGAITIAEGATGDFAKGTGITLILKIPAGFDLNTGVTPNISVTAGTDITSAAVAVTDSHTITITLTVSGTTSMDTLVIGNTTGIQVRPTVGTPLATGNHIYRPIIGGGTATITGIATSVNGSTGSNFGNLTEVGGVVTQLAFTTEPAGATAGSPFSTQPVVKSEDQFGNPATNGLPVDSFVAVSLTSGTGPLQGTTSANLGMNSGKGTATYSGLQIDVAGNNKQLTATSTSGLTSTLSSVFTVSPGTFVKLQLLMPGETAAPGTPTGKTGTPTAQTAGTAFTVTVNGVDANWNLVTSASGIFYYINIVSSDANATLPANAYLTSGTQTFSVTFKTAGSATVTASDVLDGTKTPSTSPSTTVNTSVFAKLQLLMPGEMAAPGTPTGKTGTPAAQTAGTPFNVTVNAVDANWNLINSAGDTVGITSSDANATLPSNAALSGGTQTFSVTFNTAGSRTVTATDITDGSKTANTSPATTVNSVGPFAKLQLLMPGETAAPGTPTGKTGTPTAQIAGTAFSVKVNAVDTNWNVVTTVSDTVGIASSDANALLPASTAMINGTQTFSVTFKTAGSATVTASDALDGTKTPNTSPSTTVNVGAFTKLQLLMPGETAAPGTPTGKTGTPTAQTAGTAFTVTINGVDANWNLVTSASGIFYYINIASSDANATLPGNADLSSGTQTFSVTFKTAGSATVTASDVLDGTKTPSTSPSTTVNTSVFAKLQLLMPGETAAPGTPTGKTGTPAAQTAGTPFNVTVNAVDANWNLINSAGDTVGITSSDANATLPSNAALSGGTQTFSVTFNTAGSRTVTATDITDGSKTANTSPATTVNAGAVDHYAVTVSSPNNAGMPFMTTVTAQDSFNNTVTTNTAIVTLTATGNVRFDSNGDNVYGDNTKALTNGVLTIATKDDFAETVNITATANSNTGTLTGVVITPVVGAYESVAMTGNWNDPATWNTYDGSSWVAATVPPASTNAPTITIQSNTTVTVTADVTAGGLIVQSTGQITVGSGQTLTITNGAGTDLDVDGTMSVLGTLAINSVADVQIEAGGSLQNSGMVNVVGTLTASSGASVVVNSGGILQNSGTVTSSTSTLTFNSGATYQHTFTTTGGTIPTATWNANSTCAIIGYTSNSSAPSGLGQAFANFTWSCTNQQSGNTFNLGGTLTTVNGDFTVTTTGSGELRLGSSESGDLSVGGSFSQKGGTFRLSGNASRTVSVTGNFSLSGGTFDINAGGLLAFNTVTLNVGGNFSPTAGTFTETCLVIFNTANMAFNGAGSQTCASGATVSGTINFTVNSGSTLVMGTSTLTGGGSFTLSSGADLQIGSPAGITTSGATGNIQVTGTRTFNPGANYTYNGTAAQTTGNGLPTTVNNLTITNSAGVTLTATVTVNGVLTLTNGVLITSANLVNIAAAGSIEGGSSSSYVSGTLQMAFNTGTGQSFTYPIGDASNYTPFSLVSMNVTAAGSLAAKTTAGDHPSIATSGIDATRSVNRYWTLTASGSFAATDNATFNYLATDVDGAATVSQFVARRFISGAWQTTTVNGTPTTNATTIIGAIVSGDIAIGDQAVDHYAVGAATPQTENSAFTTTVTAQDALNQLVVNDSSTVVTMSSSSGTVQFDSNGDGSYGDNTKTLSGGGFTISTKDTAGETITLTATDSNAKTGTSPPIVVVNKANQTISINVSGNQFTLTWPTTVGLNYQVEYKDNLDDPVWTPLGVLVAGTGNLLNVNDNNNNAPHRFYRLTITQP